MERYTHSGDNPSRQASGICEVGMPTSIPQTQQTIECVKYKRLSHGNYRADDVAVQLICGGAAIGVGTAHIPATMISSGNSRYHQNNLSLTLGSLGLRAVAAEIGPWIDRLIQPLRGAG